MTYYLISVKELFYHMKKLSHEALIMPASSLKEQFNNRAAELAAKADNIEDFEAALAPVLEGHGFRDLSHYWEEKAQLLAILSGGRPPQIPFKHRRRTPEDDQKILEMSQKGVRSIDIAKTLGLSQNTVCNVRKMLRDQKKL